jgi:hypothetical protein
MTLYLNFQGQSIKTGSCVQLVSVCTETPNLPETPPAPWLAFHQVSTLNIIDLDTADGREAMAAFIADIPLYRISLELLVDKILLHSYQNPERMKGVTRAFAPEDAPEPVIDSMSAKYAFTGVLHFPIIASRSDVQLIELYLRLFGPAVPEHTTVTSHLLTLLNGYPEQIMKKCDGFMWRGAGWVRLDRIVYDIQRQDHDPEITFESYVNRGRRAAESIMMDEPTALLAAWVQAERVQRTLCLDIDAILRLNDIKQIPHWIKSDIFRLLEREAMKQVFAEGLNRYIADWASLRRTPILMDPISANARGEVAPLLQQLLNQTLSADAAYAGAAGVFAAQGEHRFTEALKLLG